MIYCIHCDLSSLQRIELHRLFMAYLAGRREMSNGNRFFWWPRTAKQKYQFNVKTAQFELTRFVVMNIFVDCVEWNFRRSRLRANMWVEGTIFGDICINVQANFNRTPVYFCALRKKCQQWVVVVRIQWRRFSYWNPKATESHTNGWIVGINGFVNPNAIQCIYTQQIMIHFI